MSQRPCFIAHVIYRLDFGGLENGLVNLINALPASEYRHAIICINDYTDFSKRLEKDVEIIAMHKKEGHDVGLYLRLWQCFRRLRPDIVHSRNLAGLEAQLPAFVAGVKYRIHGEHGRDVHDLDNRSAKYRWLRKVFSPFIKHYITVSTELAEYLTDSVGIPAQRVTAITNGVDTVKFSPACAKPPLPEAPFAVQDRIVIGTVGRMQPVKDPLNLVRAFIALYRRVPASKDQIALVLVGDGPLRTEAAALLNQAGLRDSAWLAGARDDAEAILKSFDIFVLPSLAEGISNTILEAMASGLPVVATAAGGNAELVVVDQTGLLVPRGDPEVLAAALQRYCEDAALRKRHGAAARRWAESEFSLRAMVDRYASVYQKVLAA